jgi:nucleoside-diphosphate-sugar epimerase
VTATGAAVPYTIFGGSGFIGSEIARLLTDRGHPVVRVGRDTWPKAGAHLGHVIFTIGMTADFRSRLVETVELQVLRLHEALTRYRFASFTYLSSARVYDGAQSTDEDAPLLVRPAVQDHVYNISKLAGESLCLAHANPEIRVVRLSNVFGAADTSNLFLTAVIREAVETGGVTIGQSPNSSKDYVHVSDVAAALVQIAGRGQKRLYNIATGANLTHQTIADILLEFGYKASFKPGGSLVVIPPINVSRLSSEFGIQAKDPAAALRHVLHTLQTSRKNSDYL